MSSLHSLGGCTFTRRERKLRGASISSLGNSDESLQIGLKEPYFGCYREGKAEVIHNTRINDSSAKQSEERDPESLGEVDRAKMRSLCRCRGELSLFAGDGDYLARFHWVREGGVHLGKCCCQRDNSLSI